MAMPVVQTSAHQRAMHVWDAVCGAADRDVLGVRQQRPQRLQLAARAEYGVRLRPRAARSGALVSTMARGSFPAALLGT